MVVGVGGGFDDRDRGGARTGAPSGRSVPGHPRYTPCVTRARGFRIIAASLAGPRIGTAVVNRALNTVTSVCLERATRQKR